MVVVSEFAPFITYASSRLTVAEAVDENGDLVSKRSVSISNDFQRLVEISASTSPTSQQYDDFICRQVTF